MDRICIVSAKRTPQGKFLGGLKKQSAVDLAVAAGESVLGEVRPKKIDQVIIGNVLMAGSGMNIARQVSIKLGMPIEVPAFTVNMQCASGIQAVILAAQAIKVGDAKVVLCGGTESMSNAPFLLNQAREGYKLGDRTLIDCILQDGLVDSFNNEHMGFTAERIAEEYKISRNEQDKFALRSHQYYAQAQAQGKFDDERIAVDDLEQDEHPRLDTTLEKLALLKPAFKVDGTVTAGNASGINDGAAMLIVCDEDTAQELSLPPLAIIGSWASVGCDPKMMGLGPVYATRRLCEQEQLQIEDFDTIEINEAFASQTLACMRELKIKEERLNPEGGAIALGHPIGTSGARLLVHLACRINQGKTKRGLATLCVGGGMGTAMSLEKVGEL
jgi:acetyl-CoA C-acetyltransferase